MYRIKKSMQIKRIVRRFRLKAGLKRNQKYICKNCDKYIQKVTKLLKYKRHIYETKEMPYYCKWMYLDTITEEQESE